MTASTTTDNAVTIKKELLCSACGSKAFRFRWEYKKEDEMTLYLCHEGIGFQLVDSIITCDGCGAESQYEQEDFLILKELEAGKK